MLFDTHTHLSEDKYDADREQLIADLPKNNVGRVIDVGDEIEYSKKAVSLANSHEIVYATVGVHPYSAKEMTEADIDILRELAVNNKKVIGVGECGLDYHENHYEYKAEQKIWFRKQIDLAQELDLPLIVHVRDAYEDCLEILKEKNVSKGIIHCFSGTKEFMEEVCEMGFYVAFGGAMTYSNADDIREAAKFAPEDRILIETDCPYLVPKGVKVSRNEPKFVAKAAEMLAEIRGVSIVDIEDVTWYNACKLFNL